MHVDYGRSWFSVSDTEVRYDPTRAARTTTLDHYQIRRCNTKAILCTVLRTIPDRRAWTILGTSTSVYRAVWLRQVSSDTIFVYASAFIVRVFFSAKYWCKTYVRFVYGHLKRSRKIGYEILNFLFFNATRLRNSRNQYLLYDWKVVTKMAAKAKFRQREVVLQKTKSLETSRVLILWCQSNRSSRKTVTIWYSRSTPAFLSLRFNCTYRIRTIFFRAPN